MSDIKVGDTVKRIDGCHCGMKIGDTATVLELQALEGVKLAEFRGTHSGEMLEVVTQQKTVADAYEWAEREWDEGSETIWWDKDTNQLKWGDYVTDDTVCTREQFEAYAKGQEAKQEGEKWTHTHGGGVKCKVIAEDGEHSWVLNEHGSKVTEYTSSLKPIKPTLTKAEAEMMSQMATFFDIAYPDFLAYIKDNFDTEA